MSSNKQVGCKGCHGLLISQMWITAHTFRQIHCVALGCTCRIVQVAKVLAELVGCSPGYSNIGNMKHISVWVWTEIFMKMTWKQCGCTLFSDFAALARTLPLSPGMLTVIVPLNIQTWTSWSTSSYFTHVLHLFSNLLLSSHILSSLCSGSVTLPPPSSLFGNDESFHCVPS